MGSTTRNEISRILGNRFGAAPFYHEGSGRLSVICAWSHNLYLTDTYNGPLGRITFVLSGTDLPVTLIEQAERGRLSFARRKSAWLLVSLD